MSDDVTMQWSTEKNRILRDLRGIGFEDVKLAVEKKLVLANITSPSKTFPHQRMLVVEIDNYAHAVPYVEQDGIRFLKTIFPSRVLQKKYGRKSDGSP